MGEQTSMDHHGLGLRIGLAAVDADRRYVSVAAVASKEANEIRMTEALMAERLVANGDTEGVEALGEKLAEHRRTLAAAQQLLAAIDEERALLAKAALLACRRLAVAVEARGETGGPVH